MDNKKYHYHKSQDRVWSEWDKLIYKDGSVKDLYRKHLRTKDRHIYVLETKGMMEQLKRLLTVNPNHYYKANILSTISNYERILFDNE